MNGLARNTKGHWVATHKGQRVTFTEQRFGETAELLARRALLAMQSGTYDEFRDNALLKQSYSRELAAKVLGIHVGELNEWLLSGVLRGQEITPPRPDNRRGAGKISGYELAIVQDRMKENRVN
ncbi:hypothetical protein ACQ2HG_20785 [Aeromonas hydrophila]|uniref:hypothetical protein n=1 Tax=Aeromonas TaxID=642 RepID=UPI000DE58845|nr:MULTISPECIES: hypothetical protein [Aeromonas]MDX7611756.1 hypothetical protein [Aeromonas caviae]TNI31693.1 hypothetical protein CF131_13770 [Aeromonas dhakensis]